MTSISCKYLDGIFKTNDARELAILYNLKLNDVYNYISNDGYVTYYDIKYIIAKKIFYKYLNSIIYYLTY